jgi:hypothetical protein
MGKIIARSLNVPEASLIRLPVDSLNADYGTDEQLLGFASEAADTIVARFPAIVGSD